MTSPFVWTDLTAAFDTVNHNQQEKTEEADNFFIFNDKEQQQKIMTINLMKWDGFCATYDTLNHQ